MRRNTVNKIVPLTLLAVLLLAGCGSGVDATPTPDYDVLAADVQQHLAATLTAQAPPLPTATVTPLPDTPAPTEEPTQVPTLQPTLASSQELVYVRLGDELATNIVLTDLDKTVEQQLTHFVEPLSISDVSWSADGEWLVFASAHDYARSRDLERNVFLMRADGSEFQMITGDYTAADEVAGPFVTLSGQVQDAGAGCLVMAQGATSPVLTDERGMFELSGVPVSSTWARAICPTVEGSRQGTVDLALSVEYSLPISIELQEGGQGWTQVSLSPDGTRIAGSRYAWSMVDGQRAVETTGLVMDLETGQETLLDYGVESTITGLQWSANGAVLMGTVYDESGVSIVSWNDTLSEAQELLRLDNPEDIIYSAFDPAWSADGTQLAFSLKSWYWWGDSRYKSDIVVLNLADSSTMTAVESEWGIDARKPSWTVDGDALYYQVNASSSATESTTESGGIWRYSFDEGVARIWIEAGEGYLPVARPGGQALPEMVE